MLSFEGSSEIVVAAVDRCACGSLARLYSNNGSIESTGKGKGKQVSAYAVTMLE